MKELQLTIPEGWHQLTEPQLEYLANLLLNKVPEQELLIRCFNRFSGLCLVRENPVIIQEALCYFFRKKKCGEHFIPVDLFADMVSRLDWIIQDVKLFKNPEKIKGYHACNHKLYGLTLEEYLIADQMYIAYAQTEKTEYLDKMVAIFYRLKNDRWEEGKNLHTWIRRFRNVPHKRKHIVFLWYTGVKAWIIETYPYIFSTAGGEPISPTQSVLGILAVLNSGDVSKNPEIKKTELHEALDMLNRKCEN
jgi:hypothetical protein